MENTVYCIASTEPHANEILQHLRNVGFGPSEVSVLLKDKYPRDISLRENVVRGAEKGGIIGGVLGGLAGLTALTVPAVGVLMVAGPIITALSGAAVGGAIGGLAGGTGALTHLGIHDDKARRLEDRIRTGGIFIAVHTHDSARLGRAMQVFKSSGAEEVCLLNEKAA